MFVGMFLLVFTLHSVYNLSVNRPVGWTTTFVSCLPVSSPKTNLIEKDVYWPHSFSHGLKFHTESLRPLSNVTASLPPPPPLLVPSLQNKSCHSCSVRQQPELEWFGVLLLSHPFWCLTRSHQNAPRREMITFQLPSVTPMLLLLKVANIAQQGVKKRWEVYGRLEFKKGESGFSKWQ